MENLEVKEEELEHKILLRQRNTIIKLKKRLKLFGGITVIIMFVMLLQFIWLGFKFMGVVK